MQLSVKKEPEFCHTYFFQIYIIFTRSHALRGNVYRMLCVPPAGSILRKKMSRSRYKIIEKNKPHFVTCTTIQWLPLFSSPSAARFLLDSLSFFQEHSRMTIYAYVIMENHVHMILSSPRLSKEIGIFKSYTARQIIDFFKERHAHHILQMLHYHKLAHKKDRQYQLWQEGSHPQAIINEEMMLQKIEYIHYNPVKRGYVDAPEHWRYSSARNYAGDEGLLGITHF